MSGPIQEMISLEILDPAFADIWFIEGSIPEGEDEETSNIYVLDEGRVVIDTGNISELGWYINEHFPVGKVEKVIITHPHFDHTTGLSILLSIANPRVYLHPDAIGYTYMGELSFSKVTKESGREDQVVPVSDGDVIEAGSRAFEVIHTPGHMVGGIYRQTHHRPVSRQQVEAIQCALQDHPIRPFHTEGIRTNNLPRCLGPLPARNIRNRRNNSAGRQGSSRFPTRNAKATIHNA